ncbi:MAG: hypothetical protein WCV67_00985 [Victivallaceae bacterium]
MRGCAPFAGPANAGEKSEKSEKVEKHCAQRHSKVSELAKDN